MAAKSARLRTGGTGKSIVLTVIVLVIALVVGIGMNGTVYRVGFLPTMARAMSFLGFSEYPLFDMEEGDVAVHFIDVGQGDCTLIQTSTANILIDCGEEDKAAVVIRYLESRGIRKLDVVIATHPHSDHIGGMADVLKTFRIGRVLMPELSEDMIPFSQSYSRLLDVIETKSIPAFYARAGERLRIEGGTYIDFLAPIHDDYESLNNFSLVCKLSHGKNRFLLCADIERASENDMLNSGADVESDVIKIAHHGSTSSSTPAFLKAVSPRCAVISVGRQNVYGHPMPEVLERLSDLGVDTLTTAELGNIVFVSDGGSMKYYTESGREKIVA